MKTTKSVLQTTIMLGLVFFVFAYNDTPEFQSVMRMIFGQDSYLLTDNWLDVRDKTLSAILIFIIVIYYSVWRSYAKLIRIYSHSPLTGVKPSLNPQEASFLYLQKSYLVLSTWLIEHIQSEVLYLHYKKGIDAWSLTRNPAKLPSSESEQKLLDILFKQESKKSISDYVYKPDPQFSDIAERRYKILKKDSPSMIRQRYSAVPAWLFVIGFLIELPAINHMYQDKPGLVAIGFLFALATGVVVYIVTHQLPYYFNRNKFITWLVTGVFFLVAGVIFWGITGIYENIPWFSSFIYVQLMVAIAVAITFLPNMPENEHLLSQIIGYQKFLQQEKSQLKAEDLPWLIALDAAPVFSHTQVQFNNDQFPDWLKADGADLKEVIQEFFNTFSDNVNYAVNGKSKSSSLSGHSSGLSGREI